MIGPPFHSSVFSFLIPPIINHSAAAAVAAANQVFYAGLSGGEGREETGLEKEERNAIYN